MARKEQLDVLSLVMSQNYEDDVQLIEKFCSDLEKTKDFDTTGGDQEVLEKMFDFLASESKGGVKNLLKTMITYHIKKTGGDENAKKLVLSVFDEKQKIAIKEAVKSHIENDNDSQSVELVDEKKEAVKSDNENDNDSQSVESVHKKEEALQATHCNKLVIKKPKKRSVEAERKRKAKRAEREKQKKKEIKEAEKVELLLACCKDDVTMVKKLLAKGHSINMAGNLTLLGVACDKGSLNVVRLLLKRKASVEDRGIDGNFTPLMIASSRGYVDIVNALLERGALVDAKSSSSSATSLIYAVLSNSKEVVEALLRKGADPTISMIDKKIPTLIKKYANFNDILKILTEHKSTK